MKNAGRICFLVLCFLLCIFPFAGMIIQPAETSTENRRLAQLPSLREDGAWNKDYLQQLGTYFQDHFAFRQALVSADAEIQSRIFGVSNVDTVTVGSDGWLYYTATMDDYLGRNPLSERSAYNIAHNLALVQQYVQKKGAVFLFTAAPNKNSLYGEHMPYYLRKKAGSIQNMEMLKKQLLKNKVSYADLFELFGNEKEQLYLKRDSHWNQKGAILVYDKILTQLGVEHDNYETAAALRLKEEYGDLNKMLYPLTAEPEWNYYYEKDHAFRYLTETKSVEDAWIETENREGSGSLLMFRDSFGNTLLPLMADVFAHGFFSKGVPQNITKYMEECRPDIVILEKVERNIRELTQSPPVMEAVPVKIKKKIKAESSATTLQIEENDNDTAYWKVSGVLDPAFCAEDVNIYVSISDGRQQYFYKTFYVSDQASDYGFQVNIPKKPVTHEQAGLEVIAESGGEYQSVQITYADLSH